ncbi:VOC family protein [Rhodobacterales bacterium]|nr:VOC family protein [Rhodobacterales bacterium]
MNFTPDSLALTGLRHLALWIPDSVFEKTASFYRNGMGMDVVWHPNSESIYLSSGSDNLALYRVRPDSNRQVSQTSSPLNHFGFTVASIDEVRNWHSYCSANAETLGIIDLTGLEKHGDGAESFYFKDPAGNPVQLLFIPGI